MRTPTEQINEMPLLPFLKWAGGKRWLLKELDGLIPKSFNRYFEPFLGSGAVFFHLAPKPALLADLNKDLVDTYTAIKQNPKLVERYLRRHQAEHSERHYYRIRASQPNSLFTRAARFIYLNRTCWNGLYRVNLKGEFNVPIGTKSAVILDSDDFSKVAERLSQAELRNSDFEPVIDSAGDGDFVFIDPPYTVAHNVNGFVKYNERLFTWDDQIRLKNAVVRARQRGASILVLNAYHESVVSLYSDVGRRIVLERKSVLAADSWRRRKTEELAVCCL